MKNFKIFNLLLLLMLLFLPFSTINNNQKKGNQERIRVEEKLGNVKLSSDETQINNNQFISKNYKKRKNLEYITPAYDYDEEFIDDKTTYSNSDSNKDSYENNNSFKNATLLSNEPEKNEMPGNYSVSIEATLHKDPWFYLFWRDIDEDYFRFDVYGNASVSIILSNIPATVDYDLELYMHDNTSGAGFESTEMISELEGCQGKYGVTESITKKLGPGTYYARVFPCGEDSYDAINKYNLKISVNYLDRESVSIQDLRYNKGCKAALWMSDFNPVGIKPFSTLDKELIATYPGPQIGGVGCNPLLKYVYNNHTVEHASLYLWDNEICSFIHNQLKDNILPNLIAIQKEYDKGRLNWETKFEIINGVNTLVSISLLFLPSGYSIPKVIGAIQIFGPPTFEFIIRALFPEYWDTHLSIVIGHVEDIIRVLAVKGNSTDDSQVIKISSVYTTIGETTPSSVINYYAHFDLELPIKDFIYHKDMIPTFNERSYVYGHIYGIRDSQDFYNAISGIEYTLDDINTSLPQEVMINQAYINNLNNGEYNWYKFTAPTTGFYDFYTEGQDIDTFGELFYIPVPAQSIFGRNAFDDDSGVEENFNIHFFLDKGQTVFIRVRGYYWLSQQSYSFKVNLTNEYLSYTLLASDFSSFVNNSGQGQYFFYEKQKKLEFENGLKMNTRRLRCSYIENQFLVLSANRENAGKAFLELEFEKSLKAIQFNIGLWSSIEAITSANSTVFLQYKTENGEWITAMEFMKIGMHEGKYNLDSFYVPFENADVFSIRFIVNVTNPGGDRNKGRVVLDNLTFYFEE